MKPAVGSDHRVLRFVALRRSVSKLARSVAFYCDGLGFEVADSGPDSAHEIVLALGAERLMLTLRHPATPRPSPVAGPDLRFQHVAIVASDMDAAFARLQRLAPVAISRGGPQQLPAASGGVRAFKFRDADGHPVELIEFPPGQGAPRWHDGRRDAAPTLGIDHAAISVADVDRSIAFYRSLGLRIASRQLNRGAEQARLDGLETAEVDVVALVPAQPDSPHLELLAYRTPKPVSGVGHAPRAADQVIWQASCAAPGGGQPRLVPDPDGHLNGLLE